MAEQDAGVLRRDLEKVRRRHATEVATLQQRILESRLQKTAVCPMCVMAERVKFQFTEVDAETAQAELEAEARAMALKEEQEWMDSQQQVEEQEDVVPEYHHSQQYEHPAHMQTSSDGYHSEKRDLSSPQRHHFSVENRSHQHEQTGNGSDWSGELESEGPRLDEFEIDHFFTHT